jgi:arylsulfatase A-like enzyme
VPAAADYFGVKAGDARVPDIFGIAQYGVVYTGGTGKVAEHGGAHSDDLNVPLVVSGACAPSGVRDAAKVRTKQIAPTILSLLGLDPRSLQAVRQEHTQVLPTR